LVYVGFPIKKVKNFFFHCSSPTTLATFFPQTLLLVFVGSNGFPNVTLRPSSCLNMSSRNKGIGASFNLFLPLKRDRKSI